MATQEQALAARLDELRGLIAAWPGLAAHADAPLLEDALVLLGLLGDARSVIDVGSGGGLPGIPLKLARPDIELTLLESNQRKAAFLVHACARLGIPAAVVRLRAEDAGHDSRLREAFDAAVARAVASLPVLAELCLPLVRVGGRLLAMKVQSGAELELAREALATLGGRHEETVATPSELRTHGEVLIIRKISPTPAGYPRRAGVPARRPLGAPERKPSNAPS
jgi:16S rRNA (guanine527-N7)-methyltransferase